MSGSATLPFGLLSHEAARFTSCWARQLAPLAETLRPPEGFRHPARAIKFSLVAWDLLHGAPALTATGTLSQGSQPPLLLHAAGDGSGGPEAARQPGRGATGNLNAHLDGIVSCPAARGGVGGFKTVSIGQGPTKRDSESRILFAPRICKSVHAQKVRRWLGTGGLRTRLRNVL